MILAPYTEFSAKRSSLLPLLADSFSQSLGEIGHVGVVQIFTFSMNIDFLSLNGFWLNASLTIIHSFFSGSELYIHSTQEGRGDHVSVMWPRLRPPAHLATRIRERVVLSTLKLCGTRDTTGSSTCMANQR